MAQTNTTPPSMSAAEQNAVTWWCKIMTQLCGTLGGILAMAFGVLTCITFASKCFIAGVLIVFFGFIMVTMEAPCFCLWLDCIDKIARFSESRKPWHKAAMYLLFGLLPLTICQSPSALTGSVILIFNGLLYGTITLGRKADLATMMARAETREAGFGSTASTQTTTTEIAT